MSININEHGFWDGEFAMDHHAYDKPLSDAIVDFLKRENVTSMADLGCGLANYVSHFIESGINATGYDGNPKTPELTNGLASVLDLAIPFSFDKPYEWIMSIEVGEHLPAQYEEVYMQNLHNNNEKGIIMSWALKGQGGLGHYNEHNNEYIKEKMMELGYTNDIEEEDKLRKASSLWWFKNTLMVFRKIIPN